MKLIITGAPGFVVTGVLCQSLELPQITSVVALARKPVSLPEKLGPLADKTKFTYVKIDDYGTYNQEAKQHLIGANACIWTATVLPGQFSRYEYGGARKACHEDTLVGLKEFFEASQKRINPDQPFRFMYTSGWSAERDQSKKPFWMPKYLLLRVSETESAIADFAAKRPGQLEVCSSKPGIILAPGETLKSMFAWVWKFAAGVPNISVNDLAAGMLYLVGNGFEKDPIENYEIADIGQRVLKKQLTAI